MQLNWVCVVVFHLIATSLAILHWDGDVCQEIVKEEKKVMGSGCVAPGSIKELCAPCVYDSQCESGWCESYWKKCYKSNTPCGGVFGDCENCPSSHDSDLSECECVNPDFPQNYVECTDGSGGMDVYDMTPKQGYSRKENIDGSLAADDDFAIHSQCFHNKYREEAAKLGGLDWNVGLAAFAHKWATYLKTTNGCQMKHSGGSDRSNLGGFSYSGENLFIWSTSGSANYNEIPKFGESAPKAWYSEMKYYVYGGSDDSFTSCDYRNDKGGAQIGHLTQMLWHSTTDLGCDFAVCDGNWDSVLVVCIYGPGGNIAGKPAFNETSYCALNQYEENVEKYNGLPRCDGGDQIDCSKYDEGGSGAAPGGDGKCPGQYGGTCVFPWSMYGVEYKSCKDSNAMYGYPLCQTEYAGWFDLCKYDETDPDCIY